MCLRIFLISFIFLLNLQAKERIISLSPSITEIVFALEKGHELVGTSSYSLYPKEAKKLPIVGGYQSPSIEKILALQPTLVIGQNYNQNTLAQLEKFGIKTLELHLKTINNIKDSIIVLSKRIHATNQEALNANIDNALTNAKANTTPHSVMIVYGLREDLRNATYIAGHNIFYEDIIQSCGNTNAYTEDFDAQLQMSSVHYKIGITFQQKLQKTKEYL